MGWNLLFIWLELTSSHGFFRRNILPLMAAGKPTFSLLIVIFRLQGQWSPGPHLVLATTVSPPWHWLSPWRQLTASRGNCKLISPGIRCLFGMLVCWRASEKQGLLEDEAYCWRPRSSPAGRASPLSPKTSKVNQDQCEFRSQMCESQNPSLSQKGSIPRRFFFYKTDVCWYLP